MAGLRPIFDKYSPELRENIKVEDILTQLEVYFPEINRFRNSDKKEDINILIEVIGRIDDNGNNDLSCSVSFLKCLQMSKASCIRLIAEQIISEAEKVFPDIRLRFLPPSLSLAESGTKIHETPCSYLRGDVANVKPRSSTQSSDIGIPSTRGDLKFLAAKQQSHGQNSRNNVTLSQYEIGRFCADTKIEDIPNGLFLQLVEELNEDKHWKKIGNKMGLARKEMREFEKSENPSKTLLDHVGDRRLRELAYTCQAAGIIELLHGLSISLIEEQTDTKIKDIPHELFLQLVKELNADNQLEIIGNKLGLAGKEMREFEKKSNPAIAFFNDHQYLTIEKLCNLMQGLHFDPASENPTSSDSLTTQRYNENNVHEEITAQDVKQFPPNTEESRSENTHDNNNSNTLTPPMDLSSFSSTRRFSISSNASREGSSRENSLTHLKNCASHEQMESSAPNIDALPFDDPSNLDLDKSMSENTEITPVSDNLDNDLYMSRVLVNLTSDKPIVTCPEIETQSEKNPETAATALLNDAYAQYDAGEFRDIQNSIPCSSENNCSRVANPVIEVENYNSSEQAATNCEFLEREYNTTTNPATNISSPTNTYDSEEKNPEQECDALINDGTAQVMGTEYRDIQNSLPDIDEMEES